MANRLCNNLSFEGLESGKVKKVTVFGNPTHDKFTLWFPVDKDVGWLEIYDVNGECTEPSVLEIFATSNNPTCDQSNGTVILNNVLGGGTPYVYVWSNGSTNTSITGLLPGIYTLTVTDNFGCQKDTSVSLSDPGIPEITLDSIINIQCNGDSSGSIFITVNGGYSNYTYTWSNSSTIEDLINLPFNPGGYTVMVYDSVGCGDTSSFVVTDPQAIIVSLNKINASCGTNTGSFSAIVSGGVLPYFYVWSSGQTIQGDKSKSGQLILSPVIQQPQKNWRTQISYRINRAITLGNRTEIVWFDKKGIFPEQGFLTFFDLLFKPPLKPYAGSLRLQYFETEGYNSRVYAYENDVLYSFSIPAFYDKGYRYYLNINYDINRKFSLWARFAQTIYRDKSLIGSGLDEIEGKRKTEVKIQALYKF